MMKNEKNKMRKGSRAKAYEGLVAEIKARNAQEVSYEKSELEQQIENEVYTNHFFYLRCIDQIVKDEVAALGDKIREDIRALVAGVIGGQSKAMFDFVSTRMQQEVAALAEEQLAEATAVPHKPAVTESGPTNEAPPTTNSKRIKAPTSKSENGGGLAPYILPSGRISWDTKDWTSVEVAMDLIKRYSLNHPEEKVTSAIVKRVNGSLFSNCKRIVGMSCGELITEYHKRESEQNKQLLESAATRGE
jgi:hypothetical protein